MRKFTKPPKLNLESNYHCGICNSKFLGFEYSSHKSKCAPNLDHKKYVWAIKIIRSNKVISTIPSIKTKIQNGYYKCPLCNRAVLNREFNKHYNITHPKVKIPSLTEYNTPQLLDQSLVVLS
jgi:hypothetical protein